MGCCQSTAGRALPPPLPPPPPPPPVSDQTTGGGAADVISEVEEKVKEVLCETPAAYNPSPPPPVKVVAAPSEKSMSVPEATKIGGPMSGRASSTTAPANPSRSGGVQRRAELSPVRPRHPRTRSLSADLGTNVGRDPGKLPTRIRPDGIGGSMSIVRFEPGGSRGRVDRATGAAADRVQSMRRTDMYAGRAKIDPNGSHNNKRKSGGGEPKHERSRESLESPLVSLECFIFL